MIIIMYPLPPPHAQTIATVLLPPLNRDPHASSYTDLKMLLPSKFSLRRKLLVAQACFKILLLSKSLLGSTGFKQHFVT